MERFIEEVGRKAVEPTTVAVPPATCTGVVFSLYKGVEAAVFVLGGERGG